MTRKTHAALDRNAWSVVTIEKAYEDGDQRIIEGIATTPKTDRVGDIVEPDGAEFELPIPLLWKHDRNAEIGLVERATVTAKGIKIRARLVQPKDNFPPAWRALLDEAWYKIKEGVVRGLSIGFRGIEVSELATGGLHFLKWTWLELSAVTIQANEDCKITATKSLDENDIKALDEAQRGVSAAPTIKSLRPSIAITPARVAAKAKPSLKGNQDMKLAEQIKALEDDIKRKTDAMIAIQTKASGESRTKDDSEKEEFDRLDEEIKTLKEELADLKKLEAHEVTKAAPAEGKTQKDAEVSRGNREERIFFNNQRAEKGLGFAHAMMCLAVSKESGIPAVELAKEHYSYDDRIAALCKNMRIKAAVAGGVPSASAWAGSLMNPQDLVSEFVSYMWAGAILGRLQRIRRVPFNYKIPRQTGASSANWTGAGKPAPVSKLELDQITIGYTSLTGLVYIAKQNLRFAHIDSERLIRDDMAGSLRTLADTDFVDPANSGTANIKPASITNGLTPVNPSGTDGDAATVDIKNVIQKIVNANLNPAEVSLIMRGDMALGLSTLKNALGQFEFPDLGPAGGTLLKLPVIPSNSVKPGDIIAVHEPSIYAALDDQVMIEMSGDASIEALDGSLEQDGTDGTGSPTAGMISMFQTRMMAFLAEMYANWVVSRTNAVATIVAGNYNGTPTA